jgi:hypothetical protein
MCRLKGFTIRFNTMKRELKANHPTRKMTIIKFFNLRDRREKIQRIKRDYG